jgi:aryl-alcohol dehydrogenase-like predicted oxidoreductase
MQLRSLGATGIQVPALGTGTNRWSLGKNDASVKKLVDALVDVGATFFDTAEIYTLGNSERLVGASASRASRPLIVATKFAPLPWRITRTQFASALDASLARLGMKSVDLYYLHFPFTVVGVENVMDWMAEAVNAGKVRAVGVSNCSAAQMHRAAARLARHGVKLAANQVHYNLFHRAPEKNGVLAACRDLDVALVAYRPLAGGRFLDEHPLTRVLDDVAKKHGAHRSSVALAFLLRRDPHVIAIPGATSAAHALENLAALDLALTDDDVAAIDRVSP